MPDWLSQRGPWLWAITGVVVTFAVLGYFGQLHSIPPIDRTLNPDARNYWQSASEYSEEIVVYCTTYDENLVPPDMTHEEFKRWFTEGSERCIADRVKQAGDRGYFSEAEESALLGE